MNKTDKLFRKFIRVCMNVFYFFFPLNPLTWNAVHTISSEVGFKANERGIRVFEDARLLKTTINYPNNEAVEIDSAIFSVKIVRNGKYELSHLQNTPGCSFGFEQKQTSDK